MDEQNQYLQEHPRARSSVAQRKVEAKAKKLKIDEWVVVNCQQRTVSLRQDKEQLQEIEKLDGCYVLKTDLSAPAASKELVHERYKDLALVEWVFRTSKTVQLEVRPVHVRLASRTRGHVLVVTLAYWIIKELSNLWRAIDVTVEEGLKELQELCVIEVRGTEADGFYRIPEPRASSRQLLEAAQVRLPEALPNKGIVVATKKKLPPRRKAA